MNPLLQQAIFQVLVWGLTFLAGYLVRAGIWSQEDAIKYVTGAALALITLGWMQWNKYKSRQKQLVAQASPQQLTEDRLNELVRSGQAPSVLTPKDQVPILEPPSREV